MTAPPRAAVVDYGAGNLRSVAKALARSGFAPDVSSDPAAVRAADVVVLPGVGAFADAMASLRAKGLDDAVREASLVRRLHPFLEVDPFGHFLSGPGHRDRVAEGLRKAGLE